MNTIKSLDMYEMKSLISDVLLSVIKLDSESYIKPFRFREIKPSI